MSVFFDKYHEIYGYIYPEFPQDQELGEIHHKLEILKQLVFTCPRSKSVFLEGISILEKQIAGYMR